MVVICAELVICVERLHSIDRLRGMQVRIGTLTLLLVVACSSSSPDPALDVESFEITSVYTDSEGQSQTCGFGMECFTLAAVADGTQAGTGSCEIWATSSDGENVAEEPGWSSGEFEIESGQIYKWEAQASIPSDPKFAGNWDASCTPAPEG